MTTHPYDDIEPFALGTLEADDAKSVLEHADRCATCAVLVAEAMRAASALEPEAERPLSSGMPAIKLMGSRRSPNWTAIVGLAAVIALMIWNVELRANTLFVPVASLVHSHFEHHPLRGVPGVGSAKVIQALDGSWLYLVGDGLQPNTTYRLWDTVAGTQREVGSFRSNARGQATAFWQQTAAKIEGFSASRNASAPKTGGELHWP